MSATRTDAHRPSTLVTEDYEYVMSEINDLPMAGGWVMRTGDFGLEVARRIAATDRLGRGTRRCHHCGARLNYFAVLEHTPTGDYIVVGETCLDNRFERSSADFHRLRKMAELDRAAMRIRQALDAFAEAHPDLTWMADRDGEAPAASAHNTFVADVARRLRQYGEISERQIEAVRKAIARDAEAEAQRAATPPAGPVPVGPKVDIEGEVVGRRWHDNDFGGAMKITVRLDNGARVWFTEPSSVTTGVGDIIACRLSEVTASDRDDTFGFGKRPSRFTIVKEAEVAA